MTAINALVMADATHVFADAGRFLAGTTIVADRARKVWEVGSGMAFLFCGNDDDGDRLRKHLSGFPPDHLRPGFAEVVKTFPMARPDPFTAFLFGAGWGLAVEESGQVHSFGPGNRVRTLASDLNLDPGDIVGSGIALAEDQRRRHGVVAGWLDYACIGSDGIRITTVRRWEWALG